jgi:predicted  nucleic acid-binding Zn-ribbon protein
MDTHEEFSLAERELDQILFDIKKQRSSAHTRSRIFATIPVVITLALFTVISRAAAHYQQRLINTEGILKEKQKEVDGYKSRLDNLIAQPRNGNADELSRLLEERETLADDVNRAINELVKLRGEMISSSNGSVESLNKIDGLLQKVLSNDDGCRQRTKEAIDLLDKFKGTQGINGASLDALGALRGIKYDTAAINEARGLVSLAQNNQRAFLRQLSQFAEKLKALEGKQRALRDKISQIDNLYVRLNSKG